MHRRMMIVGMMCGIAGTAGAEPDKHRHKHHGRDGQPGRGWGVGRVPPGHAKRRYGRGDRLPDDGRWIIVRNPDRYRLPRLGRDEMYVRVDDQLVRAGRDTRTVIEAIGIVSDWIN